MVLVSTADRKTQASFDIGGDRAAAVLPLMLKPGAMGKMPAEQRARLRQVTGVQTASLAAPFLLPCGPHTAVESPVRL